MGDFYKQIFIQMSNWNKNIPLLKMASVPRYAFSTGDLAKFCGKKRA